MQRNFWTFILLGISCNLQMYIGSMHIFTEKYSMCHQQDQAAKVWLFVHDFDTLDRILWIQISETLSLFTCQETFLEVFF